MPLAFSRPESSWFSRRREFRADAGGANLAGRKKMIAALERLQSLQGVSQLPERVAAFGISGGGKSGWANFFSTHPALEDRIAALRASGGERRVAHQPMGS
ncbi:M48 family metalloprotease [Propionivibrio sp.]|uniref:M48 family metalloprotease n=1 Tax=Propionivibrio sp. TaxID=2212460 RepID=UPI0034494465